MAHSSESATRATLPRPSRTAAIHHWCGCQPTVRKECAHTQACHQRGTAGIPAPIPKEAPGCELRAIGHGTDSTRPPSSHQHSQPGPFMPTHSFLTRPAGCRGAADMRGELPKPHPFSVKVQQEQSRSTAGEGQGPLMERLPYCVQGPGAESCPQCGACQKLERGSS